VAKNESVESYFNAAHAGEAAEALLGITDQRAQRAKNQVVKDGLREAAPHGQEAHRGRHPARGQDDRQAQRRGGGLAFEVAGRADAADVLGEVPRGQEEQHQPRPRVRISRP
jgi:hypothetical protein